MRDVPYKPSNLDDQDQVQDEGVHIKLYQSYSNYWYEMSDPLTLTNLRKDEYDINFEYAIPTKSKHISRYVF
jgi:hypothetical protein